jgi:N-methylhydantoinase B/oxoprolinase/acetone carboxylase alpha subunit
VQREERRVALDPGEFSVAVNDLARRVAVDPLRRRRRSLPSKVPHMQIRAGAKFVCVGPAGGGYGDPLVRDPARVREDVADGFVSAEAAKSDYGVVLSAPGSIDEAATACLRGEMIAGTK